MTRIPDLPDDDGSFLTGTDLIVVYDAETGETKQASLDELSESGLVGTSGSTFATDVEVTDATKGIILKSPNGTRWRVTVGNDGALSTTSLA